MASAKDNAIALYLEGIQNGHPREAVAAYTGAEYIQHSTGVADGAEGFIAFFEPFLARNPKRDFNIVRAFQEGSHVFIQCHQRINDGAAEWLTTDFFDSDVNGKIIEHWDVIAPIQAPNASGHSQIDGPTDIEDRHKTAQNKALVRAFIDTCLIRRDLSRAADFIDATQFVQHSPDLTDGLEAFLAFYAAEECPLAYQECFLAITEGNFVATLNRATWEGQDLCQVDLFRVKDGKIVEHWDNAEPVPPKEDWANSGKF